MAKETQGSGGGKGRPVSRNYIKFDLPKPVARTGTDKSWLLNIEVTVAVDLKLVARCRAKLIKEEFYNSDSHHFFSAMMDQSNTMGDLAQLLLWSEDRWVFEGPWQGMKEYGDRVPARERLDEETRQSNRWPNIPKLSRYCKPRLFTPREGTADHLPQLQKRQWVLLFTEIDVAKAHRGRGFDADMVMFTLKQTRLLAQKARRPFLAAVEPGCMQFKRFADSDPNKFEEIYGSMRRHWPGLQNIKARQEKFWLDMGFQKFKKPFYNTDISNFFFWSGLFDLPKITNKLRDPENPRRTKDDGIPKAPEHWIKSGERRVRPDDDSVPTPEEPPEKRARMDDDVDTDPGNNADIGAVTLPEWYESLDQIGECDLFNFDIINWEDHDQGSG